MRNQIATGIGLVIVLGSAAARAQGGVPAAVPPEPAVAGAAGGVARTTQYGSALRLRWVSVPGWFLSLFTDENVPLSSYAIGGEFFRRKGDMDIAFGLTWQKMGPPDGNWLGRGEDPALETDLLQFRNFGMVAFDISFLWRTELGRYVSTRYGMGLGLGIITGKLLRVSAGTPGCKDNPGDEAKCVPIYCPPSGCTEVLHKMNEGRPDTSPVDPHRFAEPSVPGALPVLNFVVGLDFRIPDVKGFEFRLDAGFYDAFFLGLGGAYLF